MEVLQFRFLMSSKATHILRTGAASTLDKCPADHRASYRGQTDNRTKAGQRTDTGRTEDRQRTEKGQMQEGQRIDRGHKKDRQRTDRGSPSQLSSISSGGSGFLNVFVGQSTSTGGSNAGNRYKNTCGLQE